MNNVPDPTSVRFLLRCLSVANPPSSVTGHPSSVSRKPLAVSFERSPDWPAVLAIAANHGLTPLLYTRLKQRDAQPYVPADVWGRLQRIYIASSVIGMSFFGKLRKVLQRLRASGISVIVLKGAYLAQTVYADDAVRPMVDVDLLVPKDELPRARDTLLDMGGVYRQFEQIESTCARHHHLPQIRIHDLAIEVHWTILSPAGPVRVDAAGLRNRALPAMVAGVEVLTLSPEDLLLHLCLHASYSERLRAGLRPFCDVAETIQRFRSDVDWVQVVHSAREWGATRYVGLTLHLARSMLDAGVPDDVLEQLAPGGLDQRVLWVARQSVLAQTGYAPWVPFFRLLDAPSLGDKARLAWQRVFLSRDEMAATYPACRPSQHLYWYYARRVGHVVLSYVAHTLRRARLLTASPERESSAALVNWLLGKD